MNFKFHQKFEETFSEAWDRFKDLLQACHHHGFTELHQLDTFYNSLNFKPIRSRFVEFCSRWKSFGNDSKASNVDSSYIASVVASVVTSAMTAMSKQHQAPASVKAVEESYVTCGGAHSYRQFNRIDVIYVLCEEYAQEVLGFLDISKSGNSTPSLDPILSTSFPSLTPFEGGDFILEEIEACLTNDSIPPEIDDATLIDRGDLFIEKVIK
ncbi:hypothetical protein Tco_0321128 [Tanacetum coccineum]